ncbi:MAG TPA: hypothetical protein VHF24_09560 [Acidimicrobiales bacterium]|nr:hypothetical protein [Acidimicrobiales bacterium]
MTSAPEPQAVATCSRCGRAIEGCALCEQEACGHLLCYRCVRVLFRQELAHPHIHGG